MHFFRAREAAESWAEGRTGIVVLTLEEGYALARAHWIEPSFVRSTKAPNSSSGVFAGVSTLAVKSYSEKDFMSAALLLICLPP